MNLLIKIQELKLGIQEFSIKNSAKKRLENTSSALQTILKTYVIIDNKQQPHLIPTYLYPIELS